MKTIWKYPIDLINKQAVAMPKGAVILTVQMQDSTACLWAMVDPDKSLELRVIELYGTGHSLDNDDRGYIGTFQTQTGLVFHVFEWTGQLEGI